MRILVYGTMLVNANLSTVKNSPLLKESGEDLRVTEDAGVEPPEVIHVSAKRKKAGRRSSGIWRYFSDIPTGMLAKYNFRLADSHGFLPYLDQNLVRILKLNFTQKI
jgi:hypothetical protein